MDNLSVAKDYCVEKDGERFAGLHLLIELWGACNLDSADGVELAMRRAAEAAGATIIESTVHQFSPAGIAYVLLLAESHISMHTWPEYGFAAVDVFTCGQCDPHAVIPVLQEAFKPERLEVSEHWRGKLSEQP